MIPTLGALVGAVYDLLERLARVPYTVAVPAVRRWRWSSWPCRLLCHGRCEGTRLLRPVLPGLASLCACDCHVVETQWRPDRNFTDGVYRRAERIRRLPVSDLPRATRRGKDYG